MKYSSSTHFSWQIAKHKVWETSQNIPFTLVADNANNANIYKGFGCVALCLTSNKMLILFVTRFPIHIVFVEDII